MRTLYGAGMTKKYSQEKRVPVVLFRTTAGNEVVLE
jgi:hypothetical protein